MDERARRVAELLHEAGEVHHVVYRITDGADDDWASFYADWLIDHSELPDVLGAAPTRSHLVHELVDAERAYGQSPPSERCEDSMRRGLLLASAERRLRLDPDRRAHAGHDRLS